MKKLAVFALLLVFAIGTAFAQEKAPEPYQPPRLQSEGAWTMVVIPDPQSYVKFERNQGVFDLMTAWVAENLQTLNIQQVLCTGDLVECNGMPVPRNLEHYNQNSTQMWENVSQAFKRLDGRTPYVLCTGNHDYGKYSAENRDTQFSKYFPASRNSAWKGVLVEIGKNTRGEETLENAAYEFTAPNGQKILTIALQFAPTDEILDWAAKLCSSEKYANHFVILLTHSYMLGHNAENKRLDRENYKLLNPDKPEGRGNTGEKIWQKLVYPAKNIRLVVCGHVSKVNQMDGCVGFSADKNQSGKNVSQLLFDTQALGGGWCGNGGDGWLQLLEFSKDMKTVRVRTFSPLFAISPSTQSLAWDKSAICEFTFEVD